LCKPEVANESSYWIQWDGRTFISQWLNLEEGVMVLKTSEMQHFTL
jgi:hypothetical protein